MRLIGAAFVAAAGLLAGLAAARSYRTAAERCAALCRMLELLMFELDRFHTPLPELFDSLADRTDGDAAALCRRAADGLAADTPGPFADIWRDAVAPTAPAERTILAPLGGVLGRYGTEEQLSAAADCLRLMRRRQDELRSAVGRRSRLAVGLCACGGALLAVLLL